uniref:U2-theraphotoxin-Cg1b 2 n=1 Tax=Chilobrachys guangxiensis TaxID=278060 RepID=JZ41B_CHIGU|nr:RecName: Full=U2-theraphotoxin-Cg1b 2; Short=U2-TRTX-Cg1b; AltName: Full=Jingzhaotoxin-41.2; Short=JZTX-41.2; Flags: Precursor [Chilobrachys guangxiensis]ABY71717.1 cystine knot toxin [Chilobrachys guangxiensis]
MKVSVLITLAVLGVMFLLTSAEERGSDQMDSPAWLKSMEIIFQSEERECRWMFGGCTTDSDCCEHLGCRWEKPSWCAWDGTFRK